jgi:hypothetical protein
MIYRTRSQLLEKYPVLLRILRGREVLTVFVSQFGFTKSKHCAQRWINKKGPPFQSLDRNAYGTRIERVTEEFAVRHWRS